MPTALETNAAGDFALTESGLYAVDLFADLGDWTIDVESAPGGISHSADDGGKVIFQGLGSVMRYTGPVHSDLLALPSDTMQMAALTTWNQDGNVGFTEIGARRDVLLGVGGPISAPPDILWTNDGWGFFTFNKWWFREAWTHGYMVQGSTALNQWNTFGWVAGPGNVAKWLGSRVEPGGLGFNLDCSGGGQTLHAGMGHSDDWGSRRCTPANYGLEGWPGFVTLSAGSGANDFCEAFEIHIWHNTTITVNGVPAGYYVQVQQIAGTPTSHPSYVLPGRTINTREASDAGIIDFTGRYEVELIIYDSPQTPPPFQKVLIRSLADNSILSEITVHLSQPGVYGRDRYCYNCDFVAPPEMVPCPIGDCDEGIPVDVGDCDEGIGVLVGDCDAGIAVDNGECDAGLDLCPPEDSLPTAVGTAFGGFRGVHSAKATVESTAIGTGVPVLGEGHALAGVIQPTKASAIMTGISSVVGGRVPGVRSGIGTGLGWVEASAISATDALVFDTTSQTVEYRANSIGGLSDGEDVDAWDDTGAAALGLDLIIDPARTAGLYRPTGVNGNPTVELGGDQGYRPSPSDVTITDVIASGGSCTIFLLMKQDGASARNTLIDWSEGAGNPRLTVHSTYDNTIYFDAGSTAGGRLSVGQPGGWDDAWHVVTLWRDGADMSIRVDGSELNTRNNASGSVSGDKFWAIGYFWGATFIHQGDLAWISIHNAKISDAIIDDNEAFLAAYAGI